VQALDLTPARLELSTQEGNLRRLSSSEAKGRARQRGTRGVAIGQAAGYPVGSGRGEVDVPLPIHLHGRERASGDALAGSSDGDVETAGSFGERQTFHTGEPTGEAMGYPPARPSGLPQNGARMAQAGR
jgi:hypothetical protein